MIGVHGLHIFDNSHHACLWRNLVDSAVNDLFIAYGGIALEGGDLRILRNEIVLNGNSHHQPSVVSLRSSSGLQFDDNRIDDNGPKTQNQ